VFSRLYRHLGGPAGQRDHRYRAHSAPFLSVPHSEKIVNGETAGCKPRSRFDVAVIAAKWSVACPLFCPRTSKLHLLTDFDAWSGGGRPASLPTERAREC
jgi:hypothetical protein